MGWARWAQPVRQARWVQPVQRVQRVQRVQPVRWMRVAAAVLAFAWPASAQEFTYRGFAQIQSTVYPQSTPQNDEQVVHEALFRIEPAYKPAEWLTLSGSLDARIDTIEQVEREWRVDVRDRGLRRPALSLRDARATSRKGTLTLDLGKQFIRWGKADILNPTDRFAPRDFLEVTDNEFLAVIGARGQYRARAALPRRRLGPDVHTEPHAPDWRPMGAAAAGDVRPERVPRPGLRVSGPFAVRCSLECARTRF